MPTSVSQEPVILVLWGFSSAEESSPTHLLGQAFGSAQAEIGVPRSGRDDSMTLWGKGWAGFFLALNCKSEEEAGAEGGCRGLL